MHEADEGFSVLNQALLSLVELHILLFQLLDLLLQLLVLFGLVFKQGDHGFPVDIVCCCHLNNNTQVGK